MVSAAFLPVRRWEPTTCFAGGDRERNFADVYKRIASHRESSRLDDAGRARVIAATIYTTANVRESNRDKRLSRVAIWILSGVYIIGSVTMRD